jgi:DNA-binding LacI/PurR family transcriptional regulator
VAVFNDRCAVGVLDTLLRAGVGVPGDVSVVGYDDSRLARLSTVDLTTVGQDTGTMADLAVRKAIDRLTGQPSRERETVIPPRLVVRGTTAPPPAAPSSEARRRRPGRRSS